MITLYTKTGCPYCAKVIGALRAREVPFEEKNIADEVIGEALIREGGKRQVPYMIDGEVRMYESGDIVAYIEKTYGEEIQDEEVSNPTIHISKGTGNTCIPKELL